MMRIDPSRPWGKPIHGLSKTGIVLFLIGICTFGYGFSNQALPSVANDQESVRLRQLTREIDAAMEAETDPVQRERLRQRANDVAFESDMVLSESRRGDANAAIFTIAGAVITLISFVVMIVHRIRTQNVV